MSRSYCSPPQPNTANVVMEAMMSWAGLQRLQPYLQAPSQQMSWICVSEGKQRRESRRWPGGWLTGRTTDRGQTFFPNGLSPCLDHHRPNAQITMATGKLKATDVTGIYLSVVSRGGRGPLECLVRQILIRFNRDISPWKWEWGGNKMPLFYWKCKCMSVGRYSQTCNTRFRINGITQCQ